MDRLIFLVVNQVIVGNDTKYTDIKKTLLFQNSTSGQWNGVHYSLSVDCPIVLCYCMRPFSGLTADR